MQKLSLKPIPIEQARGQLAALFFKTTKHAGGPLPAGAAEILANSYFADFMKPLIFANSTNLDWTSWSPVTNDVRDMFLVAIDKMHLRFVLGIVPD